MGVLVEWLAMCERLIFHCGKYERLVKTGKVRLFLTKAARVVRFWPPKTVCERFGVKLSSDGAVSSMPNGIDAWSTLETSETVWTFW